MISASSLQSGAKDNVLPPITKNVYLNSSSRKMSTDTTAFPRIEQKVSHNKSRQHSYKKKRMFHDPGTYIEYDYLKDPSLQRFFGKRQLQEHLVQNGWFSENATCSLCHTKNTGQIKTCQSCFKFFHVSCLPPFPVTATNLRTLIIHTSSDVRDIKEQVFKTGHFRRIDDVNANKVAMSYEMIKKYDNILVVNGNNFWSDPETLGDILSEYVDNGGGVVLTCLAQSEALGGKWKRLKYSPLQPGRHRTAPNLTIGAINKPYHPLMDEVIEFNGGGMSYHVSGAVNERATVISRWSNGQPLITILDNHPSVPRGRVISLNFYPFSSNYSVTGDTSDPDNWDVNTDGCILLRNALRFVAGPTYHTDEGLFTCNRCIAEGNEAIPNIAELIENHKQKVQLEISKNEDNNKLVLETSTKESPLNAPTLSRKPINNGDLTDHDIQALRNLFRSKFRADRKLSSARKYMARKRQAKKEQENQEQEKLKESTGSTNDNQQSAQQESTQPQLTQSERKPRPITLSARLEQLSTPRKIHSQPINPLKQDLSLAKSSSMKKKSGLNSGLSKKSPYNSVAKLVEAHNQSKSLSGKESQHDLSAPQQENQMSNTHTVEVKTDTVEVKTDSPVTEQTESGNALPDATEQVIIGTTITAPETNVCSTEGGNTADQSSSQPETTQQPQPSSTETPSAVVSNPTVSVTDEENEALLQSVASSPALLSKEEDNDLKKSTLSKSTSYLLQVVDRPSSQKKSKSEVKISNGLRAFFKRSKADS